MTRNEQIRLVHQPCHDFDRFGIDAARDSIGDCGSSKDCWEWDRHALDNLRHKKEYAPTSDSRRV
jgi:hypothetical protein